GLEGDRRARLARRRGAEVLQLAGGVAALELHLEDAAVAAHLGLAPFRERVHGLRAHAVQPDRYAVRRAIELPTVACDRKRFFERGLSGVLLDADGNAAAVVGNGYRTIGVNDHADVFAEPREGLIDRVVDDLVDEVM